jgi:nucleotide-binding universal stress UspA family protein
VPGADVPCPGAGQTLSVPRPNVPTYPAMRPSVVRRGGERGSNPEGTPMIEFERRTSTGGLALAAPATALHGPVIVATDGSPAADAALVVGRRLAERAGERLHVLSVVDSLLVPTTGADALPDPARLDITRTEQRLAVVHEQVRKVIGEDAGACIEVETGVPARRIAQTASELGAGIIVVGIGRHRLRDRLLGTETALQLARLADVPVLAVPASADELPWRAVVATDFSAFSAGAARTALGVVEHGAIVYLAHVAPRVAFAGRGWQSLAPETERGIAEAFRRLRASLPEDAGATIESVTLRGEPADAVLEFAQATAVELVVVGTHGHGFFERLVLGGVSSKLVRAAPTAVLIVP